MNTTLRTLLAGAGLCGLIPAACTLPATEQDTPYVTVSNADAAGYRAPEAAAMYARDGSIVSSPPAGSVTISGEPQRDVAGSQGTRTYLLELYQSTIEERDGLALELAAVTSALEKNW